jgi:hypothetical protein
VNPLAKNNGDDYYSDEEAKLRLVAALRGARIAGHKPMDSLTKSRAKKQRKPKKKSKASA